ncbi:MAG TPA: RCC1 domain-containing protein, partial [Saprospiraceae bacterium]|nr:RCC1 domain-containing protein [Saprospiraceae bacterium]
MKKTFLLFCLAFGLSLTAAAQNPCWSEVAAGLTHTLALKTDGTLWAWGDNGEGQLGFGNNDNQNTPQQVGTDNNW